MLKKLALGLVVVIAVLAIVIMTRPATYHVERSITIAAPAELVFPQVADLRNFEAWSPWSELDPEIETTFEGPEVGVGQVYAWTGNDKVGKGSMTVTAYEENDRAAMDLEFIEPFASKAKTAVILTPVDEGTKVTWTMDGENGFLEKAMSLFMDMDQMIGADYERGLAKLETVVLASAPEEAAEAPGEVDPE